MSQSIRCSICGSKKCIGIKRTPFGYEFRCQFHLKDLRYIKEHCLEID